MATNINVVVLTGNLTSDPELRSLANGNAVCKLRVAVNDRVKEGDEWADKPGYYDVTVWGKQGENCAQYLAKGRPVAVKGRLSWHEWETENGKRSSVEIIADMGGVQFLSSGQRNESTSEPSEPAEDGPGW